MWYKCVVYFVLQAMDSIPFSSVHIWLCLSLLLLLLLLQNKVSKSSILILCMVLYMYLLVPWTISYSKHKFLTNLKYFSYIWVDHNFQQKCDKMWFLSKYCTKTLMDYKILPHPLGQCCIMTEALSNHTISTSTRGWGHEGTPFVVWCKLWWREKVHVFWRIQQIKIDNIMYFCF